MSFFTRNPPVTFSEVPAVIYQVLCYLPCPPSTPPLSHGLLGSPRLVTLVTLAYIVCPTGQSPTYLTDFPGGSAGKESTCNEGDLGLIPELGRSPGEGKGYPLQYSGLENSMDWIVHGVAKSFTWLNDFHFLFPTSGPLYLPFPQPFT